MSKNILKAIHGGTHRGYIGSIPDENTYAELKRGEIDWKEHIKNHMDTIQIPKELFYRLMALDIYLDELNRAEEDLAIAALGLGDSNENCNEDGNADS